MQATHCHYTLSTIINPTLMIRFNDIECAKSDHIYREKNRSIKIKSND